MAKRPKQNSRFGGIADFEGEDLIPDSVAFMRSVDVRSNPRQARLLPRTIKESSSIITDLPKWGETYGTTLDTYIYGSTGNIYKRTSASVTTLLRSVNNSHGNGLSYFGEDDFLYYSGDKVIGRYGPLSSSTPVFVDDFLGSQGGVPLNTYALKLLSASSQYASRASTASLAITGNITLETQVKPITLPTSSDKMVLISKWDESGTLRSYEFGIGTSSNYFGDGSDGALTISANTTDTPIDSACSGTSGAFTLTATNTSFAAGQIILIIQMQGTNVGQWQRNKIQSYTAGTITLVDALNTTYTSSGSSTAQVLVMKQYTNVTINSGKTLTVKAWTGTVGGILAFLASGTFTYNGAISANGGDGTSVGGDVTGGGGTGGGFRGGNGVPNRSANHRSYQGEGTGGPRAVSSAANGNGGGGGYEITQSLNQPEGYPGGGGNAVAGGNGLSWTGSQWIIDSQFAYGGAMTGATDLTTATLGGGGGGDSYSDTAKGGGAGGGFIFISAATITSGAAGAITANGGAGAYFRAGAAGANGAGGSILLKCQTATLGTSLITATAGSGAGNTASAGRIHIDYLTSYTGTTSPTITALQDTTLGSSVGNTLYLKISSTGLNSETYSKPVDLSITAWQDVAVSWQASSSTATFFLNGVSLGTQVGTFTSIHSNASTFNVGMYKDGTGTPASFYNGYIDEARVFNLTKTVDDLALGLSSQIGSTTAGLQAYYTFNNIYTDSTANANTLTATNSPTFVSDVPYSSPTTRLDIDQTSTTSGDTYTLTTAINEGATHRKTFTPAKDPQKSVAVLVAAKGTGDWTLTVHDQYNNTVASKTILNANMTTGYVEFVFSDPWRPLTNFTNDYHIHLTSTVADGTVTTTSNNDLTTVSYRTYFQFLVEDTQFHPIAKFLQFLVIGNERHVASWEATLYDPNQITLPAGYRVRCFGYWREFLAIGTTRGTNIYDQDSGRIYFWDGYSPTYNFYIDVPEGGVNALLSARGILYVWAGYQGEILEFVGGESAEKVKRVPKLENDKYMEVYPQAVSMWKSLLRFGVAGSSDSEEIYRGVYTYGKTNGKYPDMLTYDYPISTGTLQSTTLNIGLVMVVDKKLLIGWQDGTGYGLDYVDSSNDCYPTGTIEFLKDDDDMSYKEKQANTLVANFDPLEDGESVDVKFKINEIDQYINLGAVDTVGEEIARQVIPSGRYHQIQYAVDLASTSGTSPLLNGVTLETDERKSERRVG